MELVRKNITIVNNPIVSHNLGIIRNKDTKTEQFRLSVKKISYALIYEASKIIPLAPKKVQTPLVQTKCEMFDDKIQIILAPILRAGLIFSEAAQELLHEASVHHIGMYRDENTLDAVWYYDKKKPIIKNKNNVYVIILDPMLATGSSAKDAIENFIDKGIKQENIIFVNLICAPEGVEKITSAFPEIRIVSACLDESLNSKGYILPGLGDAGDRIFNTL